MERPHNLTWLRCVWIFHVFDLLESSMLKVNYRCKSFVAMSCGKSMNWILNSATTAYLECCGLTPHTNIELSQPSNVIAKTPLNCYSNFLTYFGLIFDRNFRQWMNQVTLTHTSQWMFEFQTLKSGWLLGHQSIHKVLIWINRCWSSKSHNSDTPKDSKCVCVLRLCDKWSIVQV